MPESMPLFDVLELAAPAHKVRNLDLTHVFIIRWNKLLFRFKTVGIGSFGVDMGASLT